MPTHKGQAVYPTLACAALALACAMVTRSGPAQPSTPDSETRLIPVRALPTLALPDFGPENMWDGNVATKWACHPDPEGRNLCVMDFGQPVDIARITILHASAGGEGINLNTEDFRFETGPSESGPWTLLFEEVDSQAALTDRTFTPVKTQFLRLVVTDAMSMARPNVKNDDNVARIPEIYIFRAKPTAPERTPDKTAVVVADARPTPQNTPDPKETPKPTPPASPTPAPTATPQSTSIPAPAPASASAPPFLRPGASITAPPSVATPAPSGAPTALTTPSPAPTPTVDVAALWMQDPQKAADQATRESKNVIVYFRSEASNWQSASDALLLDPGFVAQISNRNILLVVELYTHPEIAARFGVIRAPTLSQWTPQGQELVRLWREQITRETILAQFRL